MVDRSRPEVNADERPDLNVFFPQSGDLVTCGCVSRFIYEVVATSISPEGFERAWLTTPDRHPPEDVIVPIYRLRQLKDPTL